MNTPKWEVFKDIDGEWRWRLKAGNGEVVATSESYTSKTDAHRAIATTKGTVYSASEIVESE